MIGQVEQSELVVLHSDDEARVGDRSLERRALFAFRSEALAWIVDQWADGYEASTPVPCAWPFAGESDSPSNCWSVWARKPLDAGESAVSSPAPSGRRLALVPDGPVELDLGDERTRLA